MTQQDELVKPKQIRYVLGFAFTKNGSEVVLIQKIKPSWQAGKYNGVGGKIEHGETSLEAMIREFKEETTVETSNADWRQFASMGSKNWNVDVFCSFDNKFYSVCTNTPEQINLVRTLGLKELPIIGNLLWLIPMALQLKDDVSFAQAKVQYL